jgi:hypothetical protein
MRNLLILLAFRAGELHVRARTRHDELGEQQ